MPPVFTRRVKDVEVAVWDNREVGGDIAVYLDNKLGGSMRLEGKMVNDAIVALSSARDVVLGLKS